MPEGRYAKTWTWSKDGPTIGGSYVRTDQGQTREYGLKPVLVLRVGDEERGLWVFETALREKLAAELERRGTADFTVGERIVVSRGTEKVASEAGRSYWPVEVEFPDRPTPSAAEILGADVGATAATDPGVPAEADAAPSPADDDIPF